jgi:hypothetical protein
MRAGLYRSINCLVMEWMTEIEVPVGADQFPSQELSKYVYPESYMLIQFMNVLHVFDSVPNVASY